MSTIATKHLVHAPAASAGRFLEGYVAEQPARDGGVRIVLRAHGLARPAIVSLTPAQRPQDMAPRYTVHWEAESTDRYPVFDGILSIEGSDDYDEFRLALHGTYRPPLGLAGAAFDAIVGNRIATQTGTELLTAMADDIERRFADQEASKRH